VQPFLYLKRPELSNRPSVAVGSRKAPNDPEISGTPC
jgi:hypothetical protein